MSLPNSYTVKPNSVPAYFDAILDAQPPERFSTRFLENLGFASTNDRLLIGILKELGFLNSDGAPQQRYYDFLDRTRSRQVLAEGIKEAFGDLFAINIKANELSVDDVKNKLRTLYKGTKTDTVIDRVATTFIALCEYADFTGVPTTVAPEEKTPPEKTSEESNPKTEEKQVDKTIHSTSSSVALDSLQYHINIILPDARDQSVYDAIFRSLREHLGTRHG